MLNIIFSKRLSGRGRKAGLGLVAGWLAILPLLSLGLAAAPPEAGAAALTLDPNMDTAWKRTDLYIAQGSVGRSWLWGPQAFNIRAEEYDGAPANGDVPAGQRLVAYYDKSRMEINNVNGDRANKYFVTNGLLVKELISGKRALSDTRSMPYLPAEIPVVGDGNPDPNSVSNKAPTYAALTNIASLVLGQNSAPNRVGQVVSAYIERDGMPHEDLRFANYNITLAQYDATFGHNIPKVFWDFMNSSGPVLENGQRVNGPVVDWLFSTGYPITEAYWTSARVGGVDKDVLLQCFERRCYSYTPSNPAAFQVEMGNVGRHYYDWRYNTPEITCDNNPIRGFGKLWSENPSVRARLSCPYYYSTEQAGKMIVQKFEHGAMVEVNYDNAPFYFLPYTKTIFIVFDDGSWAQTKDTWDESQPVNSGLTPPALGLLEPNRGLGNAWRNETGLKVRERLGWAVSPEVAGDGAIQGFYNGLMLWYKPTKEIFVAYRYYNRTNVWETYPDTFVG
jgi:hypothetical protein